jgi:hypothetical protein
VSKYGLTKAEQKHLERAARLIEKQDHMACTVAKDFAGCYCTMGALAQAVVGNHAAWDAWDFPDGDLDPDEEAYAHLVKKIAPAFTIDDDDASPARIYHWNDASKTLHKTEDGIELSISALTPAEVAAKLREIAAA